ncbi:hypothetical protein OG887_43075 (plasmid) [Streptomyces sp. NBC_00053]|uniref:Uncharacterized protein n=1 Tax=Streptomyces sanglieri TaxID=193460 RepID=A0ABW2WPC5_9ACTN|nr:MULTISPECIES: hypothetical protein [unclassified Streptomyces]MCX4400097.1 hypothetical protein [Streptomyces sp. NBC_01767]MCX5103050.1 hypothetical protein [Streptomyces sp. NBC_00439]MCX5103631.1 hypothetical protein [Streptomyces sp. NBC_00439]MCX5106659.1 hypothetical protein [Streptomyces sp. NBC_00439]MCX5166318.1 hypothetical protein [Streptomyces sp. NBC_00305]
MTGLVIVYPSVVWRAVHPAPVNAGAGSPATGGQRAGGDEDGSDTANGSVLRKDVERGVGDVVFLGGELRQEAGAALSACPCED